MFIVKHFVDSLAINKFAVSSNSIIDIGTGGGFPGIPLKIMNKDSKITLIDSVNKKLNVIRDITKDMDLPSLEIIHSRAEDLAVKTEYREMYDMATTRAVSNLTTILEYMLPFVKVGGEFISYKSEKIAEEMKEAEKAIKILGGKVEKQVELTLPDSDIYRNLFVIKKFTTTPKKYPRKAGLPAKEPLK